MWQLLSRARSYHRVYSLVVPHACQRVVCTAPVSAGSAISRVLDQLLNWMGSCQETSASPCDVGILRTILPSCDMFRSFKVDSQRSVLFYCVSSSLAPPCWPVRSVFALFAHVPSLACFCRHSKKPWAGSVRGMRGVVLSRPLDSQPDRATYWPPHQQ